MRKIIFLAILVLAGCLTMPAQNNGFTVELSTVNSFSNDGTYSEYHGLEVNGGYQLNFLKRIYVEPQLGLTWLYHDYLKHAAPGGSYREEHYNKSSLDIHLGAIAGVKLCRYVGLFTGPDLRFNVWREDLDDLYNEHEKKTAAWWRFGADVFVWKLRLRGSVGVALNKPYEYYSDERNDNYTIGIAYQF